MRLFAQIWLTIVGLVLSGLFINACIQDPEILIGLGFIVFTIITSYCIMYLALST